MLDQDWDLGEALRYSETSLQKEETFQNFLTKAELLQKLGRATEARPFFARSAEGRHHQADRTAPERHDINSK